MSNDFKYSNEFAELMMSRYYFDASIGRLCSKRKSIPLEGWVLEPKQGQSRYRCHKIFFNKKKMSIREHQLVWLITHGKWPECEIDHIDRDGLNNDPDNLRLVTHRVNGRNLPLFKTNTSGLPGVQWRNDFSKWVAQVKVRGTGKPKSIYLGSFSTIFDAACARKSYEVKNGFFTPEQTKQQERPVNA